MADQARIPEQIITYAKMYAGHTAHLGDTVAIIIAQSWLETDRWRSRLWLEGQGAFGIQLAKLKKNKTWQTGKPIYLRGVPHAGYLELVHAFKDRERLIRDHGAAHPGKTIWERFELAWAPPDPDYPENENYSDKIQRIISLNGLERFNLPDAPPRPDLKPTEPYVSPGDPRDTYPNAPRGGEGDLSMPWWLTLIAFLLPKVLPKLGKGVLGDLLGAAGKAEVQLPGPNQGQAKEDKAVDLLGGADLRGIGDAILRMLIQLLIQWVNGQAGKTGLLALSEATSGDGHKMAEKLLA